MGYVALTRTAPFLVFSEMPESRKYKGCLPSCFLRPRGFTFVEIMVTLVVLSAGIVVVFKSFFYSLDVVRSMTVRIYANNLMENRINEIERMLRVYNALPMQLGRSDDIDLGSKTVTFKEQMLFSEVEDFSDIFRLDFSVSWKDGNKEKKLTRSSYILDVRR